MHKKLVAFFSLFAALCAACPLDAKKARPHHKKTHVACAKQKTHSGASANAVAPIMANEPPMPAAGEAQ